jgi:hypothetical protein
MPLFSVPPRCESPALAQSIQAQFVFRIMGMLHCAAPGRELTVKGAGPLAQ